MWPFPRMAPEAESYLGQIKSDFSPSLDKKNDLDSEPDLNPEEQEQYKQLIRDLKEKTLPEDQQEFAEADKNKIEKGGHNITYSAANISEGIPSVHLAYTYNALDETFPEKDGQWKLSQARKLAYLLKTKKYKN
ncbi:MAG: hypothetical protein NTX66_03200 [Candidatus Falkowbacteria bacterium]|nr:hypothetical protein [Candidatus Falkowbacteria bacterium]